MGYAGLPRAAVDAATAGFNRTEAAKRVRALKAQERAQEAEPEGGAE